MHAYRTHTCLQVGLSDVGKKVKIAGWVATKRDLGGIIFLDIRDQYGVMQIVSRTKAEIVDLLAQIPLESVVSVEGRVRKRDLETINPKIATGKIEIEVESIQILSKRKKELPFSITEEVAQVREDLRLQYRFLDLRREKLKQNILLRAKIIQYIREQMIAHGFTEIQTPILTSSSPEGARDFLVPSRLHPGKFYALPQAPQQFKQLLMVSGFDKYFQIAPCFRDEDSRQDRSPGEFYQLDLEMSFAKQEDVFCVTEEVLYHTFQTFSKKKVSSIPFPRIPYQEAMLLYGTDKPDLRNPLKIADLTDIFKQIDLEIFRKKVTRAICVKKGGLESRSFFDGMTEFAMKECKAKGLAWLKVNGNGSLQGPIAKFIAPQQSKEMIARLNATQDDVIFFISEKKGIVEPLAGQIRTELGKRLHLIDETIFSFCWIVDFPMYEAGENGKIQFSHNPFSMPQGGLEALETKEPVEILAYQYDLVCNGMELSSGAVRNYERETMKKAFEIAGYTKHDLETKFAALFDSFAYGVPPHAGIAPGLDRIIMLLAEEKSIREVVAFPMNSRAEDMLMKAPSSVTEEQLREANILMRTL